MPKSGLNTWRQLLVGFHPSLAPNVPVLQATTPRAQLERTVYSIGNEPATVLDHLSMVHMTGKSLHIVQQSLAVIDRCCLEQVKVTASTKLHAYISISSLPANSYRSVLKVDFWTCVAVGSSGVASFRLGDATTTDASPSLGGGAPCQ